MVPSLEYAARSVVIENTIINVANCGIKRFIAVGEKKTIDQYRTVIEEKLPWVSSVRMSDHQIVVICDCPLLDIYEAGYYDALNVN